MKSLTWLGNKQTYIARIKHQLIRNKKKKYFKSKVNEHRENPNKLWSLIKDLSRASLGENNGVRQLKENGELVTEMENL